MTIGNGFNRGRSLVLGVLLLAVAGMAWAQTPPNEPSDFTAWFSIVRIPAAGAGPVGDGTMFAGLTFPNGAQSGAIFEDYNNKRVRLNWFGPDGVTMTSAVFQFFDKQVQYNYHTQANTCTQSPLTPTFTPAFNWVANASHVGQLPLPAGFNLWARTTSPGHLIELAVNLNSSAAPALLRWQDFSLTSEMRFANFVSGQPDASVFNLPAVCGI